jgi:hypothetical protein
MNGSPIIADLDGDGDQDVAIGGDKGLALLDGRGGTDLQLGLHWSDKMSVWSHEAAPAAGVINGERHLVFTSFYTPGFITRLAAYVLPDSNAEDAWHMLRRDATRAGHAGNVDGATCGFSSTGKFCDVFESAYFSDAVDWMVDENITTGVSNFIFGPGQNLSRAQMVPFLWREAGEPADNPDHGFSDVPAGAYYDEAVKWAKVLGITTGTSPTTFSPAQFVTRGQLVTLLWRRDGEPSIASASFTDVPAARYFTRAVDWAKAMGITTGTSPTQFSPSDPVTRGQAAAFLFRTSQVALAAAS